MYGKCKRKKARSKKIPAIQPKKSNNQWPQAVAVLTVVAIEQKKRNTSEMRCVLTKRRALGQSCAGERIRVVVFLLREKHLILMQRPFG